MRQELTATSDELLVAQAQRDRNALRLQQLERLHSSAGAGSSSAATIDGVAGTPQEAADDQELNVITGHLRKIAGLEQEVKRLKKVRVPHMQAQNASCCQAMCICWRVLLTLSWWGAGPLVADVCACCSHCTIDLPGCNLSWRTCSCHLQVQRASGAFMVSHRRQSMGLPSGLGPPGLTGPAGAVMDTTSSMASEDAEAAEGSLADDEEFVAEEHAHRCTPCRPICHGCRRLLWALLQHRDRKSVV